MLKAADTEELFRRGIGYIYSSIKLLFERNILLPLHWKHADAYI